jgi:hypothetical protein
MKNKIMIEIINDENTNAIFFPSIFIMKSYNTLILT